VTNLFQATTGPKSRAVVTRNILVVKVSLKTYTLSTSNWHALSSCRCLARHLRTCLTTYTWSRKVLDTSYVRPLTDRAPFHAHTTLELCCCRATCLEQPAKDPCATRTLLTTVSGVNLRRIGFNVILGRNASSCLIVLYKYSY